MTRTVKLTATDSERAESAAILREYFPIGSTAYTVLRHVSRSGMTRHISVIGVRYSDDPNSTGTADMGTLERVAQPVNLSWHVARVMDWTLVDGAQWSLKVGGTGMDMGFHVVYSLSRALYADLPAQSGQPDLLRDAGYAISQAWL